MANIKLGDLYFSKEESKDIIKLITKKRDIKNYESKLVVNYIISLKDNLKIRKE